MTAYGRAYRVLKPLLGLVARHQGTGRLHTIVQDVDPRRSCASARAWHSSRASPGPTTSADR
jgi:hypothetical protein